jgi:hypothetical protein
VEEELCGRAEGAFDGGAGVRKSRLVSWRVPSGARSNTATRRRAFPCPGGIGVSVMSTRVTVGGGHRVRCLVGSGV